VTDQQTAQQWIIKVRDTEQMSVGASRSIEIGRKPLRPLVDDGFTRMEIMDNARSMSKRHAIFSVNTNGSAVIRDLNSTNGSYVVRSNGELMRLQPGADFLLPTSPMRLQFGDVVADFIRVEQPIEDEEEHIDVPDLFDYAAGDIRQEPDMADMSVDDILNLRAGEPTTALNAATIAERIKKLNMLAARSQEPQAGGGAGNVRDRDVRDRDVQDGNAQMGDVQDGNAQGAHARNDDSRSSYATSFLEGKAVEGNEGESAENASTDARLDAESLAAPSSEQSETSQAASSQEAELPDTRTEAGGAEQSPAHSMTQQRGQTEEASETVGKPVEVIAAEESQDPHISTSNNESDGEIPATAHDGSETNASEIDESEILKHRRADEQAQDALSIAIVPSNGVTSVEPRDLFVDALSQDDLQQTGQADQTGTDDESNETPDYGNPHADASDWLPLSTNRNNVGKPRVEVNDIFGSQSALDEVGQSIETDPAAYGDQSNSENVSHFAYSSDHDESQHGQQSAFVQDETAVFKPAFEPGSVFERVSRGDFNRQEPHIEVDGLTSDDAKRTTDFTQQFEMARHPELLPFLALNPSLYDDLYAWLSALGDKDVDTALSKNAGYEEYRTAVGK
jgi:hypothetical protein